MRGFTFPWQLHPRDLPTHGPTLCRSAGGPRCAQFGSKQDLLHAEAPALQMQVVGASERPALGGTFPTDAAETGGSTPEMSCAAASVGSALQGRLGWSSPGEGEVFPAGRVPSPRCLGSREASTWERKLALFT